MKDITKYRGIIPAFYACYAPDGSISTERVKALTRHLIAKGVKGVYVGGSSGECIYQHPDERKAVLEAVMSEAKGKITVIAHVACNNTADSVELAAHAEKCGVDAIASIPPIYFHLQDVRGQRQPVRGHEGDPAPDVRPGAGRRPCPAGQPRPRG